MRSVIATVTTVALAAMVSACAGLGASEPASTQAAGRLMDPAILRGKAFAEDNCASCHAVGRHGASPNPEAPAFRTLHQRYPVESLQEAFAEGVFTGHPVMPQFELESDEVRDLIRYLDTLK